MLFKRGTLVAQAAQLAVATASQGTAPAPSAQDLECTALRQANAALRDQLTALRRTWQAELDQAESRAHEQAATRHQADEAARLVALCDALGAARAAFEAVLATTIKPLANDLAQAGLARLVAPKKDEPAWLARSISRRLAELADQVLVGLDLPMEWDASLIAGLQAQLPRGTAIHRTPDLIENTARIRLRLGQIAIDPAEGLQAVLAAMPLATSDV